MEAYVDAVTDVPLLAATPVATRVIRGSDDTKFGFTELTFRQWSADDLKTYGL